MQYVDPHHVPSQSGWNPADMCQPPMPARLSEWGPNAGTLLQLLAIQLTAMEGKLNEIHEEVLGDPRRRALRAEADRVRLLTDAAADRV
jgi:hypothetical protein